MTNDELEAIRARDADYNDIFEQHAHRLVAWPVHDRRALLAEVDRLREVFASGASTMAQATDEIERLRDWQRRAVDWMYASVLAPGQNIRQDERQALIEEAGP